MHAEIMEILGETLEGEGGDMFAADLETTEPEKLLAQLRTVEQLVEGFCVAVEDIGPIGLLALGDCRERVQRALKIAEQAARA